MSHAHMPPVPPENRTDKGPAETPEQTRAAADQGSGGRPPRGPENNDIGAGVRPDHRQQDR